MRLAVLADIHGNLPALEAVLAELDGPGARVDAIVVAGDIVGGPLVPGCLAALRARPEPVSWVKGNGERDAVSAFDGADDASPVARHSAAALTRADRDALDGWPIAESIGGVCACHGTPRSEDEVLTRHTPDAVIAEALAGVAEPLVVGGHTHQQMVRRLSGGPDYANAGSIGLPYEGDAAAYWMIVSDGAPQPRRTGYDVTAAIARLRATDFPGLEDYVDGALSPVLEADWVSAFFEHGAGRGPAPGDPVYRG